MEIVITKSSDELNFGELAYVDYKRSKVGKTMSGKLVKLKKGDYCYCQDMYNYDKNPIIVNAYAH